MEEKPAYTIDLSAETSAAVGKLLAVMGAERLLRMVDLVLEVVDDSGYGDVGLVIREGRIVRLTVEKSIK